MVFQKATKEKSKLRCALFGPSGSGKTFTALRIATGMGGKIAVIDTERGSASKYADRFTFDVCELEDDKSINTVVSTIAQATEYDILIIDSLSHPWQELLEEIDRLAKAKYQGNSWSAWSEGTPKQKHLVNAILSFPGHIIATMRSKTEWTTEKDSKSGRNKPVRVGLSPEQGKGIEYEFDLLLEISPEHIASVLKDRTGKFQDAIIDKPSEQLGKDLLSWLSEGAEPMLKASSEQRVKINTLYKQSGISETELNAILDGLRIEDKRNLSAEQADAICMALEALVPKEKSEAA